MATETVELEGHIVDSLLLAKVLDLIVESGADYHIDEFELGRTNIDPSRTRIEISAADDSAIDALLEQLQVHGVNRVHHGDASLVAADRDGVLPEGFYSTTNLATDVRVDDRWRAVENPEMDCGIVVTSESVRTAPMHQVRAGDRIDVLFAGNGFATHDMESNVLGTSLGVSVAEGTPVEHGHSNHLRVINEIRRHGSIEAAVEAGYVTGGVMYECVRRGVPFVLGGSVRDDGPLPDTMADVIEAADAMRALVPGVAVALMLASTLHAIATGHVSRGRVAWFGAHILEAVG